MTLQSRTIFHGLLVTHTQKKKYIPAFLFLRDKNKCLHGLCQFKNSVYIKYCQKTDILIPLKQQQQKNLLFCLWSLATQCVKGCKVKVMISTIYCCASLNFLAVLLYKNVFWPTDVNLKGHWKVKSDLLSPLLCYMFSSKVCFHVSHFYWKAVPRGQNPGAAWQ